MKAFIAHHPAAFFVSAAFGVTALTGAGSLAIAAGAPLVPTLAIELGIYLLLVLAVGIFVPSTEGAATSLALATVLPFLAFFAWLQTKAEPPAAAALMLIGIAGAIVSVLAPRLRHHAGSRTKTVGGV